MQFSGAFIAVFAAELTLFAQTAEPPLTRNQIWNKIAPYFQPPPRFKNNFGEFRPLLRFDDGRPVQTAAQWRAHRAEILKQWTELLGPWPALIERPRSTEIDREHRANFTKHHQRLEIAPDHFEEAYLLVPDGAGPFPAVVVPFYEPRTSIGLAGELRDFAYQLSRRGFVTLSIGSPGGDARKPFLADAHCQPLSFLAYVAANCWNALAARADVDAQRIGIVGHSYGGKWAMFAACLYDKFACGVWSDPGIVFDETRPNVNYWEPWYLGEDSKMTRKPGVPSATNPRTGAYKTLIETGHDLHEIQALMSPRPFLVSGGAEDREERWRALNQIIAVNRLLGVENRVAMTTRETHNPTPESNEVIYRFFEHFLKRE